MTKVKVLLEGYARVEGQTWYASPSVVWIYDNNKHIIVDPGANSEELLEALKQEQLTPDDIDIIFLTHYHLDHILNIRLFPKHSIYDGEMMVDGDKMVPYAENIPGTNVKVIHTPGHASEHHSLLVKTTQGSIAIAGDVIWWMQHEEQKTDKESILNREDVFTKDRALLIESRKKLLQIADYIIPGHGKMFKVKKDL